MMQIRIRFESPLSYFFVFLTTPTTKVDGVLSHKHPTYQHHKKRQGRDLGEQLLREGHSFKRARSVPTTPFNRRYFYRVTIPYSLYGECWSADRWTFYVTDVFPVTTTYVQFSKNILYENILPFEMLDVQNVYSVFYLYTVFERKFIPCLKTVYTTCMGFLFVEICNLK